MVVPRTITATRLAANNCYAGFLSSLTSLPLHAPCRCLFFSQPPPLQQKQQHQRLRLTTAKKDLSGDKGSGLRSGKRWDENGGGTARPPKWPSQLHPTPYEIFAIPHDATYTKNRFYQLVKLYHPDISPKNHHPESSSLTHAARLERYRLVIAANHLLSDPSRRKLYDVHGLGWHIPGNSASSTLRNMDKSWRHRPGSPAMNATWEDWERWHEMRDGGRRQQRRRPTYMSNSTFAMLVLATVLVGAVAQSQRAGRAGQSYLEHTDATNAAVGDQVRRSAVVATGLGKDERVDKFLRDRENAAYQYSPAVYDSQLTGERHDKQAKVPRIMR